MKARLRRVQDRPGLLDGFHAKTGLDLGNFHIEIVKYFPPVLVVLRKLSRLRLEGRARTLGAHRRT